LQRGRRKFCPTPPLSPRPVCESSFWTSKEVYETSHNHHRATTIAIIIRRYVAAQFLLIDTPARRPPLSVRVTFSPADTSSRRARTPKSQLAD